MELTHKKCTKCLEEKELISGFYKEKRGYASWCRKCKNTNRRRLFLLNVEENNRKKSEWLKKKRESDPGYRNILSERNRKWREKNIEKCRNRDSRKATEHRRKMAEDPEFAKMFRRKHGIYNYARKLEKTYNITIAEYKEMLNVCNNKCEICGSSGMEERYFKLCIDHCHKTGKVRGLLCNSCNTSIGRLGDNPIAILKAYKYLLKKMTIIMREYTPTPLPLP